MGNPPLFPLFYETRTADCVLVQINPIFRREIPVTARDILNRVNEIAFNSSLLRELRAVTFVTRLIDEGKLDPSEYMRVRMHRISADECCKQLSASSKMNADWSFLTHLREEGRAAATAWLDRHFDDLGSRDTIDLAAEIT
jgi:NTE family protein